MKGSCHRRRHGPATDRNEDLAVLVVGTTGVARFLGTLAGTFEGEEFTARLRCTRTWVHAAGNGWRVIAAHVSPA
ncbi:nuclear transport factor 2 family protein [Streptomyces sp. NPDC014744]|uniref:nuclear transport factor 2 family protein n=1 Tax=Streptomyces sp. NPDC014744 TaxID=3364903 RepID=UPI0036FED3F5